MLSVKKLGAVLGVSRTSAYELVHSKEIPSVKAGSRILVSKAKLIEWIESQVDDNGKRKAKRVDRSQGFFRLPNDVFRIQLDAYKFKLYAYLVCRAGARGECWPSIPTMSEQLGMSKTTVQKKLKELEDRGFIKKINDSFLASRLLQLPDGAGDSGQRPYAKR